jgi:hypothetical protein
MHEVRTKFLYQVQGQADFQHCEVLKVVKLTVMTVCDDRRLSIEILGAVGTPSIRITGLTLCLLYGSLCLVGLNLVLGKVAYWALSSRTGQNSRTGPSSSRTGKVRVSVGTYIRRNLGRGPDHPGDGWVYLAMFSFSSLHNVDPKIHLPSTSSPISNLPVLRVTPNNIELSEGLDSVLRQAFDG